MKKKYITEIETLDLRLMGGSPKNNLESTVVQVAEAVADDLPF